jgi:hypothetical protein
MMTRFRRSTEARRERRWRVEREPDDGESEPEELILCLGARDNEAAKRKPAYR